MCIVRGIIRSPSMIAAQLSFGEVAFWHRIALYGDEMGMKNTGCHAQSYCSI